MPVSMYDIYEIEKIKKMNDDYVNHIKYKSVEKSANRKGFRKASVEEILASYNHKQNSLELFCYAGGLWVKI